MDIGRKLKTGGEFCPECCCNAVGRPLPALLQKGTMVRRMPIAGGKNRQTMSMKKCDITIEYRDDLVAHGTARLPPGKKSFCTSTTMRASPEASLAFTRPAPVRADKGSFSSSFSSQAFTFSNNSASSRIPYCLFMIYSLPVISYSSSSSPSPAWRLPVLTRFA